MRLELEVLDGKNKGQRISLRNGLIIGRQTDSFRFDDPDLEDQHVIVKLDSKKMWNIEALGQNPIRLGFDEVPRAKLIAGLIFNLGQTGFKVVTREGRQVAAWQEDLKVWFENNPGPRVSSEMFFFLRPIRLSFIQGPQYEEVYTLSYGPRVLGHNCLDLNIKDPSVPAKVVRFFQVADKSFIENMAGEKVTINGQPFDQHVISSGDKLKVFSNVIELSLL